MNQKQKRILKKLVTTNGQRFSDLQTGFSITDRFSYHLKFLVTKRLVNKREGRYYLTAAGMRETGTFDTRTLQNTPISTPRLLLICRYNDTVLIINHFDQSGDSTRFHNTLPSGYPLAGLPFEEACKAECLRKYGFTGNFTFRSTFHLITKTTNGSLLFDTVFLVFEALIQDAEYSKSIKSTWFSVEQIKTLAHCSALVNTLLIKNNRNKYIQETVTLNYGVNRDDL